MTPPWSVPGGARRAGAVAVPLALSLVVALVLGWRAWDAERAHRVAAERTVRDYADFAATLVGANASAAMAQTLFYAFYAVDQAERADSGPVALSDLANNPAERDRCRSAFPAGPWLARLTAEAGSLEPLGPLPPELGAWLTDTLTVLLQRERVGSPYGNVFPPTKSGASVVAYRIQRDAAGAPVAIYALAHCFETRNGNAFAAAEAASVLLPPGLVGVQASDSMLSLAVTAPDARPIYRSPVTWRSDFRGTRAADASGPLAGLSLTVTLRPELGDRLVAGGIPPSRLPFTGGLLLLAGGLILATIVQGRRALALVRLREHFVADVSHELRTPLQQILLFVQLLRMGKLRADGEREESLGIIERETRRLIRLVERLLDFAGLGADTGTPDEPVEVTSLVEETVSGFAPASELEETRVDVDVPQEQVWARAPGDALRQILSNLLDNALKYGPPGQTVRVAVHTGPAGVRLTVDDQGPGVPAADRSRVWQPFERLDREVGAARTGSGVGLAIVRELAERMEGRAWVEEAPGGGARFAVEVPAARRGPGSEAHG